MALGSRLSALGISAFGISAFGISAFGSRLSAFGFLLISACSARTGPSPATGPTQWTVPERAIRHDIPMTNMIRRAHAAGTRDSTGRPGRNYWQQQVDYVINARLEVASSTITGRETISLHNNSDTTLSRIYFRIDQNIFGPTGQRLDAQPSTIEVTPGMKLTRITVNGQSVSFTPAQGRNPAVNGPVVLGLTGSLASVFLASPIPAKSNATVEIDWNFKVPDVREGRGIRMGRLADTLYQVAQWYPRVTVFDDMRGWDTDAYLGNSEFYNNFGSWDVSLDVPAGWLVGATGTLRNPEAVLSAATRERLTHVLESDETRTIVGPSEMGAGRATAAGDRLVWRFTADTANDFAWATARNFIWQSTRATIPTRGPVPINIFFQPGDTNGYKPVPSLARHALEFYSKLWMPYGFPQLTIVDGPELGMEYPMFIMSAAGAADHETGHEWWPMMVSNNETWYGWMDEGFNQYMNRISDADRRNQPAVFDGVGASYGLISGNETESPMMWDANYASGLYSFTTYGKAPMMLSMLGAIVGDTAVQRAQSEYAKAWKFKHPSPWDYMFMMSKSLNRDLGWFWYYWLFTTESVQGSIQNVVTAGNQTTVTVRQDGQMPSPVVLKVEFAETGPAIASMPNSVMRDSKTAIVTYPVDVWFGGSKTFAATLNFGARAITKITLDPFNRFPDRNPRDNVWPR